MNLYCIFIFFLCYLEFGWTEQPLVPIELVYHSDDVTTLPGNTVTFRCVFTGNPSPTVTWDRGSGGNLDIDRMIQDNQTLTIKDVGNGDTGTYECRGMNSFLEYTIKHSFRLDVLLSPDPPSNVTSTSCQSRSAIVSWTKGFDNFSPVTKYYVEYNHSFAPDVWTRAIVLTDPTKTEAKVMLSPYARYTFRVIAENQIGKSKPSEHSVTACVTDSDTPDKHPSNVLTDTSKTGWLIIKWDRMPEIEHNGLGFRYNLIISKDGKTNKTEISDWTENKKEIYLGSVYEPYEFFIEAGNEIGLCPNPAVVHIGYTGEAAPLASPGNFMLVGISSENSATFRWDTVDTSPEMIRGEFQGYQIRYWKADQKDTTMTIVWVPRTFAHVKGIEKRAITDTVTVNGLPPYSNLEADIVVANTYFISNASDVISFNTPEGVPGPVKNAQVMQRGAHHFLLEWDPPEEPNGILLGYATGYEKVDGINVGEMVLADRYDDPYHRQAIIENLDENQEYRLYVWAWTTQGRGREYFIDAKTAVDVGLPGPVKNAQVMQRGAHHFLLEWDPPEEPNGILLGYATGYEKVDGINVGEMVLADRYDDPYHRQAIIENLDENQEYRLYVWAWTTQGRGREYFIDAKTAVDVGPDVTTTDHQMTGIPASAVTPTTTTIAQTCEDDSCQNNYFRSVMYDHIRLPPSLRPTLYNITIQPFVYDDDPKEFSFACEAIIHIDCIESTDMILIHSVDHNISFISIENEIGTVELVNWWPVEGLEMLQIKSEYTLSAGEEYVLTLRSVSSMSENLRGFYYSPYKEANQTKYIFTTMMEPTDARRVFPCFDEPDFKAVFIFNIMRKEGLKSLANLPKRLTIGPDADGYYTDIFDEPRNVPMSTYLVAIAVGDLDSLASTVNNVSFRTWCRSRKVEKTRYALEIGMKFMEFFEDYFQIPYSLPKEDMIAVPTMSFAGMEHWGLITYRESMMFYEEGVSSLDDKETMTIIIAHEVAHQWFGNLVSPFWWDDLWLNEGFATYMMFLAVDRVLPTWNMVNKQIVETRGLQNVMQVDDDMNTHPVYVAVHNPDEISEIFDLISYAKGGAVIRMMNFFLGEDTFRKGLTRYLTDFSYKTATHKDLWASLSKQAVADNHSFTDVNAVMDAWILEENYPVVRISIINGTTIQLTQSAFLETEEQRIERSQVTWKIPFVYTTDIERNFDKTFADITWITNKTSYISDTTLRTTSWIIGNIQQYGYYRVNYDEHNWNALLDQLLIDHSVIHPINRAQIITDAWNLARAGLLDIQIALKTLEYLDAELDFVPWKAALRELKYVKTSLQLTALNGLFEDFMRRKLKKAYFSTAFARDHYNRLQYSLISNVACEFQLEECIDDAMDKFIAWKQDDNVSVDPDLKEMVYCTGVKHGGQEDWAYVLRHFIDSESTSEKRFLLDALTCSTQPWLLMTLSEMIFSTKVFSKTEKVSLMAKLSNTPIGRLLAWNVLEDNWQAIEDEFGEDINLFSVIISSVTYSINTPSELNRVTGFLRQRENLGRAKTMFETMVDKAEANIKWKDKYYDTIKAWLSK